MKIQSRLEKASRTNPTLPVMRALRLRLRSGSFRKLGGGYLKFGVLIGILLVRVLYYYYIKVPLFSETPKWILGCMRVYYIKELYGQCFIGGIRPLNPKP